MKGMLAAACVMAATVFAPAGVAGKAQAQGIGATGMAAISTVAEPGGLLTLVRRGGGMGSSHFSGSPRFASGGRAFHGRRFHGGGAIFATPFYYYPYAYPYYAYNDDDCWWSRRYHRWVCRY